MQHRSLIGIFAITIGVVAFLLNLRMFEVTQELLLAMMFLFISGVAFAVYKSKRHPTVILFGFLSLFWGLSLLLYEFGFLQREFRNVVLLIGIGLSFSVIYFSNNQKWWAVIPGGVFLVIGTINFLDLLFYINSRIYAFLLFFGFGLVFFYLYLIRDEKRKLHWAIYPAFALIGFSLFGLVTNLPMKFVQIFAGVFFIILGILYIFHSSRKKRSRDTVTESNQSTSELAQNQDTP